MVQYCNMSFYMSNNILQLIRLYKCCMEYNARVYVVTHECIISYSTCRGMLTGLYPQLQQHYIYKCVSESDYWARYLQQLAVPQGNISILLPYPQSNIEYTALAVALIYVTGGVQEPTLTQLTSFLHQLQSYQSCTRIGRPTAYSRNNYMAIYAMITVHSKQVFISGLPGIDAFNQDSMLCTHKPE